MKARDIKLELIELGISAEEAGRVSKSLAQIVGESYQTIIERKVKEVQDQFKDNLPKEDDIFNNKLKELGFDNVDSIKSLQEKYQVVNEKLEATEKAEKDKHFNTTLLSTLESFNIDSSKSTLISKLMAKDDLYTEDGEINSDYLNEQVKSTVEEYLPELVITEAVQGIPEQDPEKPESLVEQARKLRGR